MNVNNNIKSSYIKENNIKNNKQQKQLKSNTDNIKSVDDIDEISNQEEEYILDLSYDFKADYLKSQAQSLMLDRENAKVSAKNQKESFDMINQCTEIANRIMNGDKVPTKDEQFLQKNNPAMYSRAITFIKQNDDPKEHEAISQEPRLEEYLSIEDIDTSSIKINLSSSSGGVSISV